MPAPQFPERSSDQASVLAGGTMLNVSFPVTNVNKKCIAHTIFINYKYTQHLAMYHCEVELLSGRIFPQTMVREIYSWKV